MVVVFFCYDLFVFKQKTAYEMRISDWSSDVCSSYLLHELVIFLGHHPVDGPGLGEEAAVVDVVELAGLVAGCQLVERLALDDEDVFIEGVDPARRDVDARHVLPRGQRVQAAPDAHELALAIRADVHRQPRPDRLPGSLAARDQFAALLECLHDGPGRQWLAGLVEYPADRS